MEISEATLKAIGASLNVSMESVELNFLNWCLSKICLLKVSKVDFKSPNFTDISAGLLSWSNYFLIAYL